MQKRNTSVLTPIFEGKRDIMNCGMYIGVKLQEHEVKIVQKVLQKKLRKVVAKDETRYGFLPDKGIIDSLYSKKETQRVLS